MTDETSPIALEEELRVYKAMIAALVRRDGGITLNREDVAELYLRDIDVFEKEDQDISPLDMRVDVQVDETHVLEVDGEQPSKVLAALRPIPNMGGDPLTQLAQMANLPSDFMPTDAVVVVGYIDPQGENGFKPGAVGHTPSSSPIGLLFMAAHALSHQANPTPCERLHPHPGDQS